MALAVRVVSQTLPSTTYDWIVEFPHETSVSSLISSRPQNLTQFPCAKLHKRATNAVTASDSGGSGVLNIHIPCDHQHIQRLQKNGYTINRHVRSSAFTTLDGTYAAVDYVVVYAVELNVLGHIRPSDMYRLVYESYIRVIHEYIHRQPEDFVKDAVPDDAAQQTGVNSIRGAHRSDGLHVWVELALK